MEDKRDFSKIDYRFSYVLSVNDLDNGNNDVIICKRDFNINNFDESSLRSIELKESIDDIVLLIDRDLKSKSRVYQWCNTPLTIQKTFGGSRKLGVCHGEQVEDHLKTIPELTQVINESQLTTFKFTFFDGLKTVITKIWSGDNYPFTVRNSVDLTNKKYKYDSVNVQALDFTRSIAQRAAVDRPDLTSIIMKHLCSVCSSFYSKEHEKRVIYKQNLPELLLDEIVFTDVENGKYEYVSNKITPICKSFDENRGVDRVVYEAYTTDSNVGSGKVYENYSPLENWEDDLVAESIALKWASR